METKNIWLIGNGSKRTLLSIAFSLAFIISCSGCSSTRQRQQEAEARNANRPLVLAPGATAAPQPEPEVSGPAEPFGPLPPPSSISYAENPDQIVLILGPGISSGFTYVGVLKALNKLKVPIRAIYASEVGALVSALYLTQPNINKMDWALLQFNERNLIREKKLVSFDSPEEKLEKALDDVLGNIRIEDLKTKIGIPLEEVESKTAVFADRGELKEVLRCTLSGANGIRPCVRGEGKVKYRASSGKIGQTYQIARQQETYPILVVSAGHEVPLLLRKLMDSQHAFYINVPLNKWDDLDLRRKNQAAFLGKQAIEQNEKAILSLIGKENP